MPQARTIFETADASQDRETLEARFPRFEEAWFGWTWRISRGPDWGYAVPGFANHYLFKSHPGFGNYGVPTTAIVYDLLDAHTVRITGVWLV